MSVTNEAFQVTKDKLTEARGILEAYEKWESDLLLCNEAWTDNDNVIIPEHLWNQMIELQAKRNKALGRFQ